VADVDPVTVRDEVHLVKGDPTSEQALKAARPAKAEHALVTGASDGDVLVSVVLLRAAAPALAMTALVHSRSTSDALKDLGVSQTISTDELLSHTLAKALETPHAGALLVELLDCGRSAACATSATTSCSALCTTTRSLSASGRTRSSHRVTAFWSRGLLPLEEPDRHELEGA
jgi:Trk K+ transport system NAD-binding subunit